MMVSQYYECAFYHESTHFQRSAAHCHVYLQPHYIGYTRKKDRASLKALELCPSSELVSINDSQQAGSWTSSPKDALLLSLLLFHVVWDSDWIHSQPQETV